VRRSSTCRSRLYPLMMISGQLDGCTICVPPRGRVDVIRTCVAGMAFSIASKICRYGRLSPLADLIRLLISAVNDFVIVTNTVNCYGGSGEYTFFVVLGKETKSAVLSYA